MAGNDNSKLVAYGRNEAQISASHERLMGIIGSATDAIITVDEEQKITLFNAAAERMFCCPASEVIGQTLNQFIPQRFREIHGEHIRAFGETGVTTRAMASQRPLMALRSDGVEFPVEATISQIVAGGQRLFTAIVRDVSERKRAEEALRGSEERYRALFEYAPDGIVISDPKGYYIDANPSVCRLLGYGSMFSERRNYFGNGRRLWVGGEATTTGQPLGDYPVVLRFTSRGAEFAEIDHPAFNKDVGLAGGRVATISWDTMRE